MVNNMTEQFVTGIVGSPYGLKGFVKIKPLSGEIGHLLTLKTVILRQHGEEREFIVEDNAALAPVLAMRFAGYTSPESVKPLAGAELLINRKDAAPLRHDEYYIEDLRGIEVLAEGKILGHIKSVIEGGGGDLAEIKLITGAVKLVPFRKEFFDSICPEKGQVILKNLWILE